MKETLKPCPFCGGGEAIIQRCSTIYVDEYKVICASSDGMCRSESGWQRTEIDAFRAWNRRSQK